MIARFGNVIYWSCCGLAAIIVGGFLVIFPYHVYSTQDTALRMNTVNSSVMARAISRGNRSTATANSDTAAGANTDRAK